MASTEKSMEMTPVKEDIHRDRLTEVMGKFGRWQCLLVIPFSLSISSHALQMLSTKWLTQPVDFWCAKPENFHTDLSTEEWRNLSAPLDEDGNFDACWMFDVDYTAITNRPAADTPLRKCNSWEFDESTFQNTIQKRWDLVCDKSYVPRVVQTLFFTGNLVGVLSSGVVGDKYGRKFAYSSFLTVWILAGTLGSVTKHLYLWMCLRFVAGAMSLGYNNAFSVYVVELTSGVWRSRVGHYFGELPWNIGVISVGVLAFFCRDMARLELIIGLSAVPYLTSWLLLPESPRWLLAMGKKEKARKVITKACGVNRMPRDPIEHFVDTYKDDGLRGSISDLVREPAVRRNFLIMCYCWFSFSMGYFGLYYNTPSFDWNPFLVFILPSLMMVPLIPLVPALENILGRKCMLTMPLLASGVMLFSTMAFPKGHIGIIICAWIGTINTSVAFGAGYTFTKELFPTYLRSTALGTASAAARVGSLLSPIVGSLDFVSPILPLITYGIVLFGAGVLSLWLWPDTKRTRLSDTVEECELLAQSRNSWVSFLFCRGHQVSPLSK